VTEECAWGEGDGATIANIEDHREGQGRHIDPLLRQGSHPALHAEATDRNRVGSFFAEGLLAEHPPPPSNTTPVLALLPDTMLFIGLPLAASWIVIFLVIHFTLTLLMVLKRVHALLAFDFRARP